MNKRDLEKQSAKDATSRPERVTLDRDKSVDDEDVCTKAPEWAEHQRLEDEDQPCDDGRSGRLGEE